MITGPKYKIARRLGAGVFEKTSTQKFALSQTRKTKGSERRGSKTEFGLQLLEKQKARVSYLLTERQFSKYVKQVLGKKGIDQRDMLFGMLETRLDNVVLKAGFAKTRNEARQLVSHGHFMVNGRRVNVPSYRTHVGDIVTIRPQSTGKKPFGPLDERLKDYQAPSWLKTSAEKKTITVQGAPKIGQNELLFDIGQVLEFYSR